MTHQLPLHTGHSLAPGLHPVPCQRAWVTWPPVCSYMTNDKQSLQPLAHDIKKKVWAHHFLSEVYLSLLY